MNDAFTHLSVLGSSLALIFGLVLLWRRRVPAYISAFTAQSLVLGSVAIVVAYFSGERELYWVAGLLFLLKGVAIPKLLHNMERRFGTEQSRRTTWGSCGSPSKRPPSPRPC